MKKIVQKYLKSLKPPYSRRDAAPVLLTLLFLLIIPITILSLNKKTNYESLAETQSILPLPMKVLVLMYFPPDASNTALLDGVETGWGTDATVNGRTIANFWEPKAKEMVTSAIPFINDASRYHGYKDASAPAFFNYQVADTKVYFTQIPRGIRLGTNPDGTPNYRPNYHQILLDHNICNLVDAGGVKEVWMYGYHSKTIVPDESRMSSKYGDVSNSYPKESAIPAEYQLPLCTNSYTLYNFTYQPGGGTAIANNIHNRLHQIENMIPFAENKWPPTSTNVVGSTFWGDFSEYIQSDTVRSSYRSSCGNTHTAPNWTDFATSGYLYNSTTKAEFNCETWNPDDSKTTYIYAACERWGCTEMGYYKWWLQNIPGFNNGIVYNGQPMKNWWEAMYDFNRFIDNGRSLYGTSIVTGGPLPTSAPSSTPTPTPPPTSTTNIALNRPTTSNRIALSGHEAAKAVDGDRTTANNSWQVANPINPGDWWQVDLGSSYPVSKIIIYPNSVNYHDMCKGFTVAVSATGAFTGEQTTVVTEVNRPETVTDTYSFQPVSGRYVRLACTVTQDWVQMQEFEVYASIQPTTTLQPTATVRPTALPTPIPTTATGDTIKPVISITSPLNNSTVKKNSRVAIKVTATDNVRVERVEYLIGSTLATVTTAPFTYTWSVPGKPRTTYTITATAYDSSNNSSSQTIRVTSSK